MNPWISRLRRPLVVAAALLLVLPAEAQRQQSHTRINGETRIIEDDGRRRLELRARGEVDFNDAGDWVRSIAPGGSFTVEERGPGVDRRLEFRPADGTVRTRYFVDEHERPLDAAGRAWAQGMIARAVRQSGLGAEARVARIRARGGVSAVLAEIARLERDPARRTYYRALLSGGSMSGAEFARVMDDVGRRIDSDVEKRLVLSQAVDQAAGAVRLAALLRAAETIDSDVETRLVLTRVANRHRLTDAPSRQAFFRAVLGMRSDVEKRLVLNAVAGQRLADGDARDAFFQAVDRMDSSVERRLVLTAVLRENPAEATVLRALQSTRRIDSDVEKRLVLARVPASLLRNARVVGAYRQVVDAMGSDTDRRIALRRLADGGR